MSSTAVTKTELDQALGKMSDEILSEMRQFMDIMQGQFDKLEFRMQRIESRLDNLEVQVKEIKKSIDNIYNILDRIEKQLEITEDERQAMAHQLRQVYDWVTKAAARIGVEFPLER